jgi:hypothetical protein
MDKRYINPYKMFLGAFLPNWLLRRQELSPGAKLCYARLAQYAGENGVCYPKQETLGEDLGVSRYQVLRYIAELKKVKLLETRRESKGNIYLFLLHEWMEMFNVALHSPSDVANMPPDSVANMPHCIGRESLEENHIIHPPYYPPKDSTHLKDFPFFEEEIFRTWNELACLCPVLPAVKGISGERRRHLKQRYSNATFKKDWKQAMGEIPKNPFLLGTGKHKWVANFDWFIANDTNFLKILEGRYRGTEAEQVNEQERIMKKVRS